MTTLSPPRPAAPARYGGPLTALRARALADAHHPRAPATAARRDGVHRGAGRAAARAVLDHARRLLAPVAKPDRTRTRGLGCPPNSREVV